MSRVFDTDVANRLEAAVSVSSTRAAFTIMAWIKQNSSFTNVVQVAHCIGYSGVTNPALLVIGDVTPRRGAYRPSLGGSDAEDDGIPSNVLTDDNWHLVVGVTDGGDALLEIDGEPFTNGGSYAGLTTSYDLLTIGAQTGPSDGFGGKIAHIAAWTRALTQPELDALAAGGSPDDIASSDRWYYYPLTDSSLVNAWTPAGSDTAGTITEIGTVTSDSGDNPAVGGGGGNRRRRFLLAA